MNNQLDFKNDGLQIFYNFIDEEKIRLLRNEIFKLFSYTQLMGPAYCIRLNKVVCEIPNPIAKIESINLLEVAIDIYKEIEKLGYKNYKLAHIALYHESNNNNELIWHSDMRNGGLIRAQIVIEGGKLNSGAFRYVKGSHNLKAIENVPPIGFLEQHKDDIVVCDKENGSLFLINTIGYHSKCVCNETRISFMFDFLPEDYILSNPNDVVSDYYLSTSRLTTKVLNNIVLFKTGIKNNSKSENTYDFYKFHKPFSGANFKDLFNVIKKYIKTKF
jgi:hypothetical protein